MSAPDRCVFCGEEGEFEDGLRCKTCAETQDEGASTWFADRPGRFATMKPSQVPVHLEDDDAHLDGTPRGL